MSSASMMAIPPTPREIAQKVSEYHDAIAPFIKQLSKLEQFRPTSYVIHPDGRFEVMRGELPEDLESVAKAYRDLIEQCRLQIFGALTC